MPSHTPLRQSGEHAQVRHIAVGTAIGPLPFGWPFTREVPPLPASVKGGTSFSGDESSPFYCGLMPSGFVVVVAIRCIRLMNRCLTILPLAWVVDLRLIQAELGPVVTNVRIQPHRFD